MGSYLRGTHLTPLQVARYAYNAGLRGDETIAIAVAIADHESKYWTEALNENNSTGDASYGLWQINTLGALWTERKARYKLSAKTDLYKPNVNALIMHDLSNGGKNWRPWGAYTSGAYRSTLPSARSAVTALNKEIKGGGVAPNPPASAKPSIYLGAVVYGATHSLAGENSHAGYRASVYLVQDVLAVHSYLTRAQIDGEFGTATKAAYAKWQKSLGYTGSDADGVPGKASLQKLMTQYTVVDGTGPTAAAVSLAAVVYGATHKAADEENHDEYRPDVLALQHALVVKKHLAASEVTGIFGITTKDAYKKWQKALGYTGSDADGVPGVTSLKKLLPGYTVKS